MLTNTTWNLTGTVLQGNGRRCSALYNTVAFLFILTVLVHVFLALALPVGSSAAPMLDFSTISAIAYDSNSDEIILGITGAVVRWNESRGLTATYDLAPYEVSTVNEIVVAANGALWLATDNGALRFDGAAWTRFTTEDGLPDNSITTVAVAPSGDVWIGTQYGAGRYDGQKWIAYTTIGLNGLSDIYIYKIVVDSTGVVWLGTDNGLTPFDGAEWSRYYITKVLGKSIYDLLVDRDGILWIASQKYSGTGYELEVHDYFQKFNGDSWELMYSMTSSAIQSPDSDYYVMFADSENRIYAEVGGLTILRDPSVEAFPNSFHSYMLNEMGIDRYKNNIPAGDGQLKDGIVDNNGKCWFISLYGDDVYLFDHGLLFDGEVFRIFSIDGTEVEKHDSIPLSYSTIYTRPNPFNPAATIFFTLTEPCEVRLTVYDVTGRKVAVLTDGFLAAGAHESIWDASGFASGVYLCRLETGDMSKTVKMTLMK